jgi:hypothetical protein
VDCTSALDLSSGLTDGLVPGAQVLVSTFFELSVLGAGLKSLLFYKKYLAGYDFALRCCWGGMSATSTRIVDYHITYVRCAGICRQIFSVSECFDVGTFFL